MYNISNWKQLKCPSTINIIYSTVEYINKLCCIYKLNILSNKSELLIGATTWDDNADIMLSEKKNQSDKRIHAVWSNLYDAPGQAKLICGDGDGISDDPKCQRRWERSSRERQD